MPIRKLEKTAWHAYLDNLSKALNGKRAEIEVASLTIGDQIQADWVPLVGLVYEPEEDIVEIILEDDNHESIDHIVHHPQEMYVDYGADGLASLEIVDNDGTQQIILLRDPLMLPSPKVGGVSRN
ncbi:MAG: DUF5335 domain-containing protein [Pseudomonadota bacterium]